MWSRLEWKNSASPGWSSTNKCSKRSRAWALALFPCFGHFIVVLHVCEIDKKMWNIERPVWPAPSLRPSESLQCLVKRFSKGKRLSFWNKWRFTWWLGDYLWVEYLLFPSYDSLLKSANDNQILGKSHTQTNIINQQPTWRQPFSFTAGSRAMKTLPMSGVRQPFSYLKIYK